VRLRRPIVSGRRACGSAPHDDAALGQDRPGCGPPRARARRGGSRTAGRERRCRTAGPRRRCGAARLSRRHGNAGHGLEAERGHVRADRARRGPVRLDEEALRAAEHASRPTPPPPAKRSRNRQPGPRRRGCRQGLPNARCRRTGRVATGGLEPAPLSASADDRLISAHPSQAKRRSQPPCGQERLEGRIGLASRHVVRAAKRLGPGHRQELASRTSRATRKPDIPHWRVPKKSPAPRISRSRSAITKPSSVATIASSRARASSVSRPWLTSTARRGRRAAAHASRSWWSWAKPNRSACSTTITVALATSDAHFDDAGRDEDLELASERRTSRPPSPRVSSGRGGAPHGRQGGPRSRGFASPSPPGPPRASPTPLRGVDNVSLVPAATSRITIARASAACDDRQWRVVTALLPAAFRRSG